MMATSDDDGGGRKWDGYSDFATVSSRIGNNVFNAIDAYADIHSLHAEDARPKQREAARARAEILSAAMSLMPELEDQDENANNDEISNILDRWKKGRGGAADGIDVPQDGFIKAYKNMRLRDNDPDWLYQFVIDIRRAGWELGYLKAGRHEETGEQEFEPRDVTEILNS